ncbi:General transcription factor II-I repeat domain-containing protein 2A [Eumeta japonica]|uniref:General transcription factor II-I repeat domain-containing protein 2A n=1 Tax=Eumeta variegata TaxID=151549 RepID=A0A4C1ZXS7_EUMVA|nr:General transcription factor II-I repeat domain-containing protein 2A [Eumeta japonica]
MIALEESTDLSDIAQLAIFIRSVDKEFTVSKELLALQPLKGTTKGEDIFNEVQKVFTSFGLPRSKLVGVCTDSVLLWLLACSVRSPAPNGRYRARPSALTKLFAFVQIAAPRPSRPCRSRRAPALAFPLQGTANPDGPGTTGLEGAPRRYQTTYRANIAEHPIVCSHTCPSSSENSAGRLRRLLFAPTNNRRLIRHLRNNRQLYDQTRTVSLKYIYPYHGPRFPCSPKGGSGPKTPITLEFIQQVPTKALSDIGYEAPQDVVKTNRESDRPSRASSRATSPMKTNKINARRAHRPTKERRAPDSTVVGSDSESENSNTSFTLVEGKNKRALRKALKKAKVARDQPEMDIDPSSAPTSRANDAKPSPLRSNRLRLRVPPRLSQPEIQSRFHAGGDRQTGRALPTAPPGLNCLHHFCAKALTSSNIRRLHPSADKP